MNNNLIGKIVCGYRIISEVGEGGMGKVYLAESAFLTEYKQQVAIKTLTGYATSERQAMLLRDLFIREANLQVQFKHPHIVSVIQFAVEADQHFLILEYMPGYQHKDRRISNVAEMIAYETGPIPHKRALRIFVQALDAMQYAHNFKYRWEGEERVGIVHRDIKPANLLMQDTEIVKVSDFGIVKVQQSKTVTQKLTPGTSAYMSPEAIMGPQQFGLTDLDARSDIYSLGITLFEMLAGRLPFAPDPETSPDISLRRKHVSEAPPPPSAFYPGIPKQLDDLVMRALAKRPEQRFQSAEEFKQAILALDGMLGLGLAQKRDTRTLDSSASSAPTERLEVSPTGAAVGVQTDSGRLTNAGTVARGTAVATGARAGSSKMLWLAGAIVLILAAVIAAVLFKNRSDAEQGATNIGGAGKSSSVTVPTDMALIEGGSFMMGRNLTDAEKDFAINSPTGAIKIFSYDYPAHPEQVKTFYLAKTETSNQEYAEFVSSGHAAPSHWPNSQPPANGGKVPVTHVTYSDAAGYCAWLTTKRDDGFVYRLPTEKEWEFAARGKDAGMHNGKMSLYPWGENWIDGAANTKESRLAYSRNVDTYADRATPAGALNLAGNVFEWTATDFSHYPGSDRQTPREAGYQGTYQVVRGGAFDYPKEYAMTTTRVWAKPEDKGPSLGFRCAAEFKR
ncbi:MAG: protein kinase domain-containing protein [Blastocatellia bacterium]